MAAPMLRDAPVTKAVFHDSVVMMMFLRGGCLASADCLCGFSAASDPVEGCGRYGLLIEASRKSIPCVRNRAVQGASAGIPCLSVGRRPARRLLNFVQHHCLSLLVLRQCYLGSGI